MAATETFGEILRRYRQAAGLSQETLAERAQISRDAVRALERGRRKAPRLDTVTLLAEALALGPDDRAALLRAATAAPLAAGTPIAGDASPPPAQPAILPMPATDLLGREHQIAALSDALRHGQTRLVTLIGPGGVGKTCLAHVVGARLRAEYADGVAFVDLSALRDPDQVTTTIAHVLGVREAGAQLMHDLLLMQLRDRHMLLLLDNFEQVVRGASQVASLLAACPRLQMLVTSRTRLRIQAERVISVPPLVAPPRAATTMEQIAMYPAVHLFLARARAVRPDFRLTDANAAAVAAVCRRLDGLPLAIELAAARTLLLAPADLLARLRRHLDVLKATMRDVPDRQRTLRATVDWSYDLLSGGEQALFRQLAVFSGGSTLEALEDVCALADEAEALDATTTLLEHGLLRQQGDAEHPRIAMLSTIRDYARERLELSGEADAVRRRHAAHYLVIAEAAEPHLLGPEQAGWLARLDREHDNVQAAIAWARARGETEIGLRLAAALWRFWWLRGYLSEGRAVLDALLARATDVAPAVLARALNGAGNLAWAQGAFDRAIAAHERCLQLLRALHDTAGVARSLSNLGMVAQHQGRYADAARYLEESLATHRQQGNERGVAGVLNNLGNVMRYLGDNDRARALHEEGLARMRALGDRQGTASMLSNLGSVLADQGDSRRARALHEESVALLRELGDAPGTAAALINLGTVARLVGDAERAGELLREGLALFHDLQDRPALALAIEAVALLDGALGDPWRAARLHGAVSAVQCMAPVSRTPSERGEYEQALAALRASLGDDIYTQVWTAGQQLSLDEAVDLALCAVPRVRAEGHTDVRPSRAP